MKYRTTFALTALVPVFAACGGSGTGSGELTKPGSSTAPVVLEWRSDGYSGGTMSAYLPTGEVFQGRYLQVTHEVQDSELASMRDAWESGWNTWPYGNGTAADNDFATVYTGRVVATLKSAGSHRLRCRFTLAKPASGMAGGGQGQCQSKDGMLLDASFPPH